MSGKSVKDIKVRWYPLISVAVITTLLLGSAWLMVSRLSSEVPIQPRDFSQLPSLEANTPNSGNSGLNGDNSAAVTSPTPTGSPIPEPSEPALTAAPRAGSARQGALRISNPTDYPVRVALLARKPGKEVSTGTGSQTSYDLPAHWDFSPQEGGTKGLIVSLPSRKVTLRKGDILVAFAQDGSRRYWGPYVVGETPAPVWSPKSTEWQLVLQP